MLLPVLFVARLWGWGVGGGVVGVGWGGGVEGADSIIEQMSADRECPFSGVTSFGRVWRKGAGKRCLELAHANFVLSLHD